MEQGDTPALQSAQYACLFLFGLFPADDLEAIISDNRLGGRVLGFLIETFACEEIIILLRTEAVKSLFHKIT